jgi:hypothetical protein
VGPAGRTSYVAGEIGQCDFWFPDINLPVGYGQVGTDSVPGQTTVDLGGELWTPSLAVAYEL